jgi:hypothetical protein
MCLVHGHHFRHGAAAMKTGIVGGDGHTARAGDVERRMPGILDLDRPLRHACLGQGQIDVLRLWQPLGNGKAVAGRAFRHGLRLGREDLRIGMMAAGQSGQRKDSSECRYKTAGHVPSPPSVR